MLVDSGAHTHVVPKTMTEGCELTGEPGQSLRSITGKGTRTWDKRTLTGEVFDSNTTISARLNVAPAEVRRGALSVAEMSDADYSVHFDPNGAKMFRSNKNVQHEIDKALETTVSLQLRRKVNAFLLPLRFKDSTGDESIIGDADEQPETEDAQMKEESVEKEPAEMQVSSGAASSRDGPRGAAGGARDSLGAPAAPGLKRP
eukprot:7194302-Pyramimonas_sp.AAC.1